MLGGCLRERSKLIRGCGIVSLVLATMAWANGHQSARAATGSVDDTAIDAAPSIAAPMPNAFGRSEPASRAQTGNPLWAIPLRSLSATRERPLFSPTRRGPAPAIVVAPSGPPIQQPKAAAQDDPQLTLVGTIVGRTVSIGIFVDRIAKSVIRLKLGQQHDGWSLRAVQDREALFEKDQREVTLALPPRNSSESSETSIPGLLPVAVRAGDTWMDGDGQLISPPPSRKDRAGNPVNAPAVTWTDGDGQLIAPPPAQIGNGR